MSTTLPQSAGPVVLLVDADNLSSPELVSQALQQLTQMAGRVTVRRAYGSAENLKGLASVLREGAFQLCLNLPLSKNTTDIALAVDAMDLCARSAPAVLAIGTGDADFAPLAVRLRALGVRTVCFAQANKMAPEVHGFYDEVVLLGARRARDTSAAVAEEPTVTPARKTAARKTPARKVASKTVAKAAVETAAVKAPARKRASRVAAAPTPPPAPIADAPPPAPAPSAPVAPALSARAARVAADEAELGQRVQALLRTMPGVAEGQEVDFNEVARALRESKLLGRSAVMSKFLKKHVPGVELTPTAQPRKLRWVAARP
jgi:uncharacterized LabA/DUF88 family protein